MQIVWTYGTDGCAFVCRNINPLNTVFSRLGTSANAHCIYVHEISDKARHCTALSDFREVRASQDENLMKDKNFQIEKYIYDDLIAGGRRHVTYTRINAI